MKIEKLIENYKEFKRIHFKKYENLFEELVKKGQQPKTFFIGCSDSRVVPDLFTGAKPGDLFIFRNVGNFIPPFKPDADFHGTAAAIEYAVSVLNVQDIVVVGHSHCGACASLYQELPQSEELIHTKTWLQLGKPAKETAIAEVGEEDKETLLRATERFNVVVQLANLLTYPAILRRLEEGSLFVHGWYYKIESGEIEYFDEEDERFKPIAL
ncbi:MULTISPECIES: carbonic anhydrase [unclassified Nitratiruptor]|uniref:carbonic anhydrase n=1 Tax=unclassified Nitratiruptor TaxID=2624044 RepID=UPI001916C654|nr:MULTISPECIES: carbonic anhydrase [unclassified Nitratiruptor]BCD59663.1 carbonic anhydrase [Nitratiruptor sp. YY08-10]BCD63587.1 carbonic anhydrase [Nitratiruptor sp. YY08-14]